MVFVVNNSFQTLRGGDKHFLIILGNERGEPPGVVTKFLEISYKEESGSEPYTFWLTSHLCKCV